MGEQCEFVVLKKLTNKDSEPCEVCMCEECVVLCVASTRPAVGRGEGAKRVGSCSPWVGGYVEGGYVGKGGEYVGGGFVGWWIR